MMVIHATHICCSLGNATAVLFYTEQQFLQTKAGSCNELDEYSISNSYSKMQRIIHYLPKPDLIASSRQTCHPSGLATR